MTCPHCNHGLETRGNLLVCPNLDCQGYRRSLDKRQLPYEELEEQHKKLITLVTDLISDIKEVPLDLKEIEKFLEEELK